MRVSVILFCAFSNKSFARSHKKSCWEMTNKQSNFIYTVLGGALLISILLYSLSSSGGGKREEERFGISEKSSKYPIAIVVLGGGLTQNGDIPLHTQLRVNKAVEMYNNFKSTGQEAKIITLSGGTTHKPNPLDSKVNMPTTSIHTTKLLN